MGAQLFVCACVRACECDGQEARQMLATLAQFPVTSAAASLTFDPHEILHAISHHTSK